MNQIEKKDAVIKFGLFAFNPIIGFGISLLHIKSNSSYLIFFLFSFIFGISFTVPSDRTIGYTGDGVAYRIKFNRISNYDTNEFQYLVDDYVEFDKGEKDIYAIATTFMVSRVTSNYHWLFGVYAIVFAFFMLKSLRFLTEQKEFTNSLFCFLLAIMFIMSNPIFNINGVRFWTAAWIGVYCLFQIFRNNDKRYIVLACLTPLVHVSFIVYLVVILIALLTKKSNQLWIVLFILSFFVSEVSFFFLESVETYLPEFISRTIRIYTDPEIIATRQESEVWYQFIFSWPPKFIVNIMILFFYKNRKLIEHFPKSYNLYLFLLVWMAFVNFTMLIPSLGGRFFQLALPFIAYIWLTVFNQRQYLRWISIFLICFAPSYLYIINLIFKVTEMEFYVTNPFYLIYKYLLQ